MQDAEVFQYQNAIVKILFVPFYALVFTYLFLQCELNSISCTFDLALQPNALYIRLKYKNKHLILFLPGYQGANYCI